MTLKVYYGERSEVIRNDNQTSLRGAVHSVLRRSIYESADFVKSKPKIAIHTSITFAKPDSPEASIRHLSGMSISSRGVAINLTVL